jgi:hypothetical protein
MQQTAREIDRRAYEILVNETIDGLVELNRMGTCGFRKISKEFYKNLELFSANLLSSMIVEPFGSGVTSTPPTIEPDYIKWHELLQSSKNTHEKDWFAIFDIKPGHNNSGGVAQDDELSTEAEDSDDSQMVDCYTPAPSPLLITPMHTPKSARSRKGSPYDVALKRAIEQSPKNASLVKVKVNDSLTIWVSPTGQNINTKTHIPADITDTKTTPTKISKFSLYYETSPEKEIPVPSISASIEEQNPHLLPIVEFCPITKCLKVVGYAPISENNPFC